MNQINIQIENLKCHGCAATITRGLEKFDEVEKVSVDMDRSAVEVTFDGDESHVGTYKSKLARLGYPEKGNNNVISVAKSYVSCAIGRVGE